MGRSIISQAPDTFYSAICEAAVEVVKARLQLEEDTPADRLARDFSSFVRGAIEGVAVADAQEGRQMVEGVWAGGVGGSRRYMLHGKQMGRVYFDAQLGWVAETREQHLGDYERQDEARDAVENHVSSDGKG